MSEKFRLDCKIVFQNTFFTKCINVTIDSIVYFNYFEEYILLQVHVYIHMI